MFTEYLACVIQKHLTGECKLEIVRGKGDRDTDTHPITYGARLRRATPSEARIRYDYGRKHKYRDIHTV